MDAGGLSELLGGDCGGFWEGGFWGRENLCCCGLLSLAMPRLHMAGKAGRLRRAGEAERAAARMPAAGRNAARESIMALMQFQPSDARREELTASRFVQTIGTGAVGLRPGNRVAETLNWGWMSSSSLSIASEKSHAHLCPLFGCSAVDFSTASGRAPHLSRPSRPPW